ncbi:MAG: hypothetical protein ACOX5F_08695 [Anaerovoracaceae bacterium]|jgi:hypothetical protein
MKNKINFKHLFAALVLIIGAIYGLYSGLADGYNKYFVIPSVIFLFLGILFARNIKAR